MRDSKKFLVRPLFFACVFSVLASTLSFAGDPKEYSLSKNGNENVSAHFKVREFACKDGKTDEILIDPDLVAALEQIRTHFGKPVIINSAYRTKDHNAGVGGATKSQHMEGKAADIRIEGVSSDDIFTFATGIETLGGIAKESRFVHIDTRPRTIDPETKKSKYATWTY